MEIHDRGRAAFCNSILATLGRFSDRSDLRNFERKVLLSKGIVTGEVVTEGR